jgi:hypothetical protein
MHTGEPSIQLPAAEAYSSPADIKPQNILIETTVTNDMFENAPSDVFLPEKAPIGRSNDFYLASSQFTCHEEDIATSPYISVRLTDFGTCQCPKTAPWHGCHAS